MKFFKTIKRKAGNALVPVIGTLLGLTVLAGAIVGVAVGSSKMVYRKSNLLKSSNAREVLYTACKYFCSEKAKEVPDGNIVGKLKEFFGDGLKVTKQNDIYYIWYPESYKPGTGDEYISYEDGTDNVEYWLKAEISLQATDDEGSNYGEHVINDTLFSDEAKIDEKFNIGNLMTTYLAANPGGLKSSDSNLLPGRVYDMSKISLVETDIDTFDEAFAYAQGTNTLLIDDIAFQLNGYQSFGSTTNFANKDKFIVYETGNLGGNYYYEIVENATGKTYTIKNSIYRQEYDDDIIYGLLEYLALDGYKFVLTDKDGAGYKLQYTFDESKDEHTFVYYAKKTDTGSATRRTYVRTSRELAEDLSGYIWDRNILKYVTEISSFRTLLYNKAVAEAKAIKLPGKLTSWLLTPDSVNVETIEDDDIVWVGENITLKVRYSARKKILGITETWDNQSFTLVYTLNDIKNFCNQTSPTITQDTILATMTEAATYTPTADEIKAKIYELAINNWSDHHWNESSIQNIKWDYKSLTDWKLEYTMWGNKFTYSSSNSSQQSAVNSWYNSLNTTEKIRERALQILIDNIGYKYIPDTKLVEIVGGGLDDGSADGISGNNGTMAGYREQAYVSKMVEYVVNNDTTTINQIKAWKQSYGSDMSMKFRESVIEKVENNQFIYRVKVYFDFTNESGQTTEKDTLMYFYFNLMTYHPLDTRGRSNNNVTQKTGTDGRKEYIFTPVTIKNSSGSNLSLNDLTSVNCPITALVYQNREGVCLYHNNSGKDQKINMNGQDYVEVTTIPSVIGSDTVQQNLYYNGAYVNLDDDDATITIKSKSSLYINGDFLLQNNQKLIMEKDALLFVNGNMIINYRVILGGDILSNLFDTLTELNASMRNEFKSQGVEVKANGANIMINGDLEYTGVKSPLGTLNVYKQRLLNYETCTTGTTHVHDSKECRSMLSGTFIVNGDVNFRALSDNTNKTTVISNFTNAYSNPLINATFYVDGIFNMRGLWTSGLYDTCRANFVFSRSIVQPEVALGALYDDHPIGNLFGIYDSWCSTHGYLFMICEDAVNFSQCNFASVNLFTPYTMMVGALESNEIDKFNMTEHIELPEFKEIYQDESIMDDWGLSPLLRQGLGSMYQPEDINAINRVNEYDDTGEITPVYSTSS